MIALLADHLWQSTLVAAVAGLLALALRRNRAQIRYAIWLATSLKFLVPFAAVVFVASLPGWPAAPPIQPDTAVVIAVISQPFSTAVMPPATRTPASLTKAHVTSFVLAAVWFCGFAAVVTTWLARWRRVAAAVRMASTVAQGREVDTLRRLESISGIAKPIALAASTTPLEPGVFGTWRPILLWPRSIADHLDDRQVEAILAHEVAHVRRRDNLAAALHMAVEALFWFYPLVWWLGTRLVDERERACDAEVVQLGSDPQVYAESILQTCQLFLESPLPCVAGVTGSNLKRRIEEIMKNDAGTNLNAWKKLLLAGAAVAAVAAPIAAGLLYSPRMRAQSIADESIGPPFRAVSVKSSAGGFAPAVMKDGRFTASMPLNLLILNHYHAPGGRIVGQPDWARTEGFDIEARVDGSPTPEQVRSMVRRLLADVFKLQVHHETRQLPLYAMQLVTRDGTLGPNLRPSTPECVAAAAAMHSGAAPRPAVAGPPAPSQVPCGAVSSRPTTFTARAATMAEIANGGFAPVLGRVVLDQTALAGHFDADVTFPPASQPLPHAPGEPDSYGRVAPFIGPGFLTAVEQQLGLRLDLQTGPVDVLVVDHVEKPAP